jgi:Flp pilus assembly protein TadD
MMTASEALLAVAAHREAGNLFEAERLCRAALAGDPRQAGAHYQLGCILKDQRRFAEALRSYQQAVTLDPHLAEAYFEAATIYHGAARSRIQAEDRRRDATAAEQAYRAAIAARPEYVEAHNNLGAVYRSQGKPAAAIECYRRILALRPDFAQAHGNIGLALTTLNRWTDAVACYDEALRMRPEDAELRNNRSLALLALGRFEEGWAECEWRWKCAEFQPPPHTLPRWDGSPLENRTLLVHAEQGLGDTLQFVRYVPLLAARGGQVILEAQPSLVPLLRQSGISHVFARGETLPSCDVWIPLMSVPMLFATASETIPRDVPYLSAEPQLVAKWHDQLSGADRFRVAIAWQCSVNRRGDQFRSIPLARFEPLAGLPGVELVSMQVGAGSEQIGQVAGNWPLVDISQDLTDFHETAAALSNVDLVISCDTSLVHAAGALGVPTWIALPFAADWRWLIERDDSPWYPTVRLFRQSTLGDWDDVFRRITEALGEVLQQRHARGTATERSSP